ncbi:MAG: HEAT repeat domain-containing protein [Planctomycetes bacterium]|nr:HEAT repeat domain-containing protein [Planctomycetota bacterium]
MKNLFAALLSALLLSVGQASAQTVKELLKDAKPAKGAGEKLIEEAKRPRYYPFKLDAAIPVYVRSVAADERGNRFSVLEVRSLRFTMDPRDNHLTAVASIMKVGVASVVRTIHVALFDGHKRLIGTGSCKQRIKRFRTRNTPVGTPADVTIDFGMSPRYYAVDSFQVVVSGRGRSEYRYVDKDTDELIRRLGDENHPEAQRDAVIWLTRFGAPVIPRLAVLAQGDKAAAEPAIRIIGDIGGEEAVDALASVLLDAQRPDNQRVLAAVGLGNTGEAGVKILAKGLKPDQPAAVLAGIFFGLARSHSKLAAEILVGCLKDPKDYYGKTRARLIASIQELGDPIAIPALIEALRDPAPRVRPLAARTLESLAKHSIPVKGTGAGSSEGAWLNASLEAREATVKEWEKWWEENKSRFAK